MTIRSIAVPAALLAVVAFAVAAFADELPCDDRDCLIGLLENGEGGRPLAAAIKLGEIADDESLAALAEALAAKDEMLATAALHALIRVGPPAAPALVGKMGDHRERVREYAAYGLSRIGTGFSVDDVLPLTIDHSIAVRRKSIDLLRNLDCTKAFPALRKLAQDNGVVVRANAVDVIGSCPQEPESIDVLMFAMTDVYPLVGDAATRAVAARGPEAMPRLRRLVSSGKPFVRIRACAAIGMIGDPGANPDLIRLIDHPDAAVARAAIRTLGVTGDKASLRALRYMRKPERTIDGVALGKYAEEAMFKIAARTQEKPIPLMK